jgi:hypothetical protein
MGVESRDELRHACVGRHEAVESGWVLRWWWAHAKLVEDLDEAFKTAVHGHYLADSWGGRREIRKMRE